MAHHRHQSANRCPSRREGRCAALRTMGIPAARMDHNQAWDASTLSGRRCVSCVLGPGRPRARCLPVDEPFEVLAHVRNDSSLVKRVGLLLERSSGVLGLLLVQDAEGCPAERGISGVG